MIPADWLVEKVTVAEAEAAHPGIRDERVQRFPDAAKPFGFQNDKWESLEAAMLPGDQLWTFCSPKASWEHRAGRSGVVLLRDGEAVVMIVSVMN
jgi:hypothetical protein